MQTTVTFMSIIYQFSAMHTFFVEFRLRSKANRKFASLEYARIPCESTHNSEFNCITNNANTCYWLSNHNQLLLQK